jgi:TRAP-type C4-dicarboxylate transport system permease small subunit
MRKSYLRIADTLAVAAQFAVKVLMAAMTLDVLLGVFFRYVLQDALTWTEETARYIMIWMGFLGTGLALREGSHVAVELLLESVPGGPRRALVAVVRVLSLGFLVSVVAAGGVLLARISSQSTPVLAISMMWPYLAIPAGCLLTAVEMGAVMLRDPDGRRGPAPAALIE